MRPIVSSVKGRVAYMRPLHLHIRRTKPLNQDFFNSPLKGGRGVVFKTRACASARFRVLAVIPAKAGIHFSPFAFSFLRSDVFATRRGGSESNTKTKGESSGFLIRTLCNNKVVAAPTGKKSKWIPAFAGMTVSNLEDRQPLPLEVFSNSAERNHSPLEGRAFPSGSSTLKGGVILLSRVSAMPLKEGVDFLSSRWAVSLMGK